MVSTADAGTRRELALWAMAALALVLFVSSFALLAGSTPAQAQATPTDVGYKDFSFGTQPPSPTGEKPQSKLWFNDGIWWGALWDPASNDFHIYRFDWASHSWSDTGTLVEKRHNSKPDVFWDGSHLYTAAAPSSTSTADQKGYVQRYSYNAATKKYTLDTGFPAAVSSGPMEAIVLDKDSTGKLWVTYTQGNKVYVNRSLAAESSWGTPFVVPVAGASNLDPDDISSVVAFDRKTAAPQVGVMWSNQIDDAVYFATHKDGDPDGTWQAGRTAIMGPKSADDHINLKSVQADSSGRVFAAVKTSFNDASNVSPNQPLNLLLVLGQDNNWSSHVFGRVADDHTRPIVVIDEENRNLYVFATAPLTPGGTIYYKKAPLDNISFEDQAGVGTPFIKSSTDTTINNVTSTKQSVNSKSGLLVEAADDKSKYYLHNTLSLKDTTPPETTIDTGPTGTVNAGAASFEFSSSEANSTFECSLDGAAFASCSSPKDYAGLADGSHTLEVRAKDAAGNTDATPASRTWSVDATAPDAPVIDSPADNSRTNTADVTVSGSAEPSTTVELFDGASSKGTTQADASGNWSKQLTGVADGTHTYTAKATDAAGNTSGASDARTVIVDTSPQDTTPPETTIDTGPTGTVNAGAASFEFSSSEANSTFECSLDGAAFASCSSPKDYAGLADGSHTFEVRATDAAGNTDSTPASGAWKVDTVAPTAQPPAQGLINGSTLGTNTVPVKLTWSAMDLQSGVSQYQLQRATSNGSWVDETLSSITSTAETFYLTPARTYQYRVRAMDGAGNWSEWAQGQTFFVDAQQETSGAITYSGAWTQEALKGAYGGAVKHSTVAGDRATFTFTGSEVAWISQKSADRGKAEVWLDGVKAADIDLYNKTAKTRQVVFSKSWATSGTHTLEVRVMGTVGRPRVDVDAFTFIR